MTDKEIYESQEDVISNLNVFGVTDSMWASGYPMSTEFLFGLYRSKQSFLTNTEQ